MTDHATFLAAIIARPDDDLPRLIYADWLEETATPDYTRTGDLWSGNGHADRAAFIRTQVELSGNPQEHWFGFGGIPGTDYANCDCRYCTLRRRERELLDKHGVEWSRPVSEACRHSCKRVIDRDFRRGFVEAVEISWPDFARHATAIRAATPLKKVRLTTWPDESWIHVAPEEILGLRYPGIEFELPARAVNEGRLASRPPTRHTTR